jgi:hypothetical protein
MVLGGFAAFSRDVLFDSDEFSRVAAEIAGHDDVRPALAAAVVDQIVAVDPELLAARPLIEIVVDGVLASEEFAEVVKYGVADLHRTVFTDANDTTTVGLTEVVFATKATLAKLDPELAAAIPDDLSDGLIELGTSPVFVDSVQLAEAASLLGIVLPIVSLVGFAIFVWTAADRRRALAAVGAAAVGAGLAMIMVSEIALMVVRRQFESDDARAVATSVWDVMTRGVGDIALWLAAGGAVLTAAAILGGDGTAARRRVDESVRLLLPPASAGGRIVWGAGAALVGATLILDGAEVLLLLAAVGGLGLMTVGLNVAVYAIVGDRIEGSVDADPPTDESTRASIGWALAGLAAALVVAGIVVAVARSGGDGEVQDAGGPGCNGSVLLCGRSLDRVAFATTHNSMAAANDGFTAGYQTVGMIPQLEDGYRGFLIDSYFGIESDGVVFTDRAPVTAEEREQLVADVGEAAVRSAEAMRESMQVGGGDRSVYLCHSFCELGAVPMIDEMSRIKDWLDAHPREVVIFVIQDEGPTEEDTAEVLEASGLDDYLYSHPIDDPWPTLKDMIDSGRRLWISAENAGNETGWYHHAFTFMQDTPFSQPTVDDFTCELNRGAAESPLFLVNHWLSPASPTSADQANSRSVLEARLEQCDQQRGPFVNLLAVDFSDRGDTVAVVADYNGVPAP